MVSHVAKLGAEKYSESGWKEVPFARKRYLDAMMRHQLAIEMGNQYDHETKAPHSAHVAWNALALAQIDAEQQRFYARSFDIEHGGGSTREWDAHPTAQAAWDAAVKRRQGETAAVAEKVENEGREFHEAVVRELNAAFQSECTAQLDVDEERVAARAKALQAAEDALVRAEMVYRALVSAHGA
jgi:hypothetical protein